MNEEMMARMMHASVAISCNEMTIGELAAQWNAYTAEFDPKPVKGYNKIAALFTELDGTKMHRETAIAFERYAIARINKELPQAR